MRVLESLIKRLRHRPSNVELPQQLRRKHDAVKAHDEKLYGDWKSADFIFADAKKRPNLVGRWDWHAWQFLLALIPAGMVYALAQYARYDMKKNPITKQQDRLKQQQGSQIAVNVDDSGEKSKAALEERLSAVETTLKTMVASLEKKSTTTPPSAGKNVEGKTTPAQQPSSSKPP